MEPAQKPARQLSAPPSPLRTDVDAWAAPITRIDVSEIPVGARSLNVSGRRLSGPVQGFGSLWQKTYRVNLGSAATPEEVVRTFKEHLHELQPPQNRFFPSVAGVSPGEVVLINARVSGMPISTGVLVLYADDEAFTLMTPEGHPESGMVTFTALRSGDDTIGQIQSLARANDPVYELGFRLMGGSRAQEAIWRHVLTSLARRYAVEAPVELDKVRVDGRLQWRQARNVWRNAIIRTTLYTLSAPARRVRTALRRQ
jgi:hypothetical protein